MRGVAAPSFETGAARPPQDEAAQRMPPSRLLAEPAAAVSKHEGPVLRSPLPHAEEPRLKRVYARLQRAMARRLEACGPSSSFETRARALGSAAPLPHARSSG